jgi:5-methylcytosine-specific restriction endonuclease McrA
MENDDPCRVLVLNRVWQPVNVIGVKRAFSLLFQEHAKAIVPVEGSFLTFDAGEWVQRSIETPPQKGEACMRTVRLSLHIPKVLLLLQYDRVPVEEVKFSRESVFERDGYRCQYTGKVFPPKMLNLDHVIPRDRGGKTSWENVVTSSIHCNSLKANRLPHEAGLRLIRKPTRPKARPLLSQLIGNQLDASWAFFLNGNKA